MIWSAVVTAARGPVETTIARRGQLRLLSEDMNRRRTVCLELGPGPERLVGRFSCAIKLASRLEDVV